MSDKKLKYQKNINIFLSNQAILVKLSLFKKLLCYQPALLKQKKIMTSYLRYSQTSVTFLLNLTNLYTFLFKNV